MPRTSHSQSNVSHATYPFSLSRGLQHMQTAATVASGSATGAPALLPTTDTPVTSTTETVTTAT